MPFWLVIMCLITVWIKMVSRGPILFRQARVGLDGRPFMILKFRSMHQGASTGVHEQHVRDLIRSNRPLEKLDCVDKRVIPMGRFLRALGLDELPQLINVLKGEMSLVGPRPCTVQEFEVFDATERQRVQVPPGLTGVWQVSGKNKLKFSEMIALDLAYANQMSLMGDLKIMLRTMPAMLTQWSESRAKQRAVRREELAVAEQERKRKEEQEQVMAMFRDPNNLNQLGSGIHKL